MVEPLYKKCLACFYIVNHKQNTTCPICKKESILENFPVHAALGFLNLAEVGVFGTDEYNQYYFNELQGSSLYICALHEILLESFLSDYLSLIGTPKKVTELLINSNQGQEKMSRLFGKLTGVTLKEAITLVEEEKFYLCLKRVISGRNHYIHGNYHALDDIDIEDIKYLCSEILNVYVDIQNKFLVSNCDSRGVVL